MNLEKRRFILEFVAFLCCFLIAGLAFAQTSSISTSVSFDKTEIQPGGTARLTITFTNPNSSRFDQGTGIEEEGFQWGKGTSAKSSLANTSLTISLPSGLTVATSANLQKTGCDAPVAAYAIQKATIGSASGSITISEIYIAPNSATCSFAVNVTSVTAGSYSVSVGAGALKGRIGFESTVQNSASNTAVLRVASALTPRISLSTNSVTFGLGAIGVAVNPPLAITISSVGDIAASLSSIGISGTHAADFGSSSSCPSSLAVGTQCTVSITFTPGGAGTRSAVLAITSDAGTAQVILAGTGASAVLSAALEIQPATLVVGSSATLTLRLTNPESLPATGSWTIRYPEGLVNAAVPSFTTSCSSGGFSAAPGGKSVSVFGFAIPAKGDCTSSVSVTSSNVGSYEVTVAPSDVGASVGGSPAVMGAGLRALLEVKAALLGPLVAKSFSPGSIMTGANATLTVSLSNPNASPMTGVGFTDTLPAGLASSGAVSNSCGGTASGGSGLSLSGGTLQANGGCQVSIAVSATTAGSYTNTIAAGAVTAFIGASPNPALAANTAGASAVLQVTPAPAPGVSFSPGSLNFGAVTINTTSGPQRATITNTGNAALDFSGAFGITGPFGHTSGCPASLVAGQSCTVEVTFAPTAVGAASGALAVASNAQGSPHSLPLSGTGEPLPIPAVTLSPASLSFPGQTVATTSSAQTLVLGNSGGVPLAISGIGTGGDFSQTNNCPATLAPSAGCTIDVTFTPLVAGTRTGSLTVTSNAPGSPHAAALAGLGVGIPAPTVSISPSSVNFPGTQLGTTTEATLVTVRNAGNAPLQVTSVDIVGAGFILGPNTCNVPIAPGGECVVGIVFAPGALGAASATLRVASNAPGGPAFVGLSGTGIPVPVGTLSASPGSLTFDDRVIGTTGVAQTVTLTNTGTATVSLSGIGISAGYAYTTTCGASLGVGGSCTVSLTFTPTEVGFNSGALSISSNASNPLFAVALSGRGAPLPVPAIELSATGFTFGNTLIGLGSAPQSFTVRNAGGAPLAISGVTVTGDFDVSNGCPAQVSAGSNCRIDVTFGPHLPGPRTGTVSILSNASNGAQTVDLAGTGCRLTFANRTLLLNCQ